MDTQIVVPSSARRSASAGYAVWPGWRVLMQDAGLEAPPVLHRARLPADLFNRTQVRLETDEFFRLWESLEAEAALVDPDLPAPLQIARVMSSDWFDPELFAALCSPDMACALDRIATYVRLIAPMVVQVDRTPAHTTVTLDFPDRSRPPPRVFLAFKLVFLVQLVRLATRSPVQPLRVGWPMPEAEAASYRSYFGVPVTSMPTATLVLAAADTNRPFLTENHRMWEFFEPSLRRRLADLDRTASMEERVRSTLLEALPAGQVAMQDISRRLAVSTRTLQRKLQDEHTTFQNILDSLRDSLAHHYLRSTAMSGAEISFLLGFKDSNSFARAFHAWTGKTPQTVRAATGHPAYAVANAPQRGSRGALAR